MGRRPLLGTPDARSKPSPIWFGVAVVIVIVIGALAIGGLTHSTASGSGNAVDFTLNDLSGKTVHLSDYRGQPVLVNLWASWCPPCRAEMPDLIQYYNTHHAAGLVLLAVNSEDESDSAQQFADQQRMPFPVLFDPTGKASQIFGAKGLPSTFLIDRGGAVQFAWTGAISPAILEQNVTPLLTP